MLGLLTKDIRTFRRERALRVLVAWLETAIAGLEKPAAWAAPSTKAESSPARREGVGIILWGLYAEASTNAPSRSEKGGRARFQQMLLGLRAELAPRPVKA